MMKGGQLPTKSLSDSNWGTLNPASRVPQLLLQQSISSGVAAASMLHAFSSNISDSRSTMAESNPPTPGVWWHSTRCSFLHCVRYGRASQNKAKII